MDLNTLAKVSEKDEDDGEESESEESEVSETSFRSNGSSRFTMTFRDVQDSLRTFNGNDGYPIEKWVVDFEEVSALMKWDALQRLVFAKKQLTGLAKLFVQGEVGISSWSKLKKALLDEFSTRLSSAELHRALVKRKKKREETVQEYFLVMKEIACRGKIEDDALIEYVIDGINDNSGNKAILYGAKNVREFKDKLRDYNRLSEKSANSVRTGGNENGSRGKDSEGRGVIAKVRSSNTRCFNCGELGHKSVMCQQKSRGMKCFACNEYGHKSTECPKRTSQENEKAVHAVEAKPLSKMCKTVLIGRVEVDALIDTGSQVNLINNEVYRSLGAPNLNPTNLLLTGFGKNYVKPQGYFTSVVEIDEGKYDTSLYVITDDVMPFKVVIGNELLREAEVTINRDGVSVVKNKPEAFLMKIDVVEEEVDICESVDLDIKRRVTAILESYKPEKIMQVGVKMTIAVDNEAPVYSRPRRLPPAERKIVDDQVDEWLKNGIIEPSTSEYASPVVVVRKKDGSPRVCIDFRRLNKIVVKDRFPLPLIEDVLDQLQDAKVYSTLDLKNGFFHVEVEESSRKYTAFITNSGQYQFIRVSFGFCNSPSVFQRYVNAIFRQLMNEGIVLPYMDDLIIPSKDETEGVRRLELVLKVAKDFGLEINIAKCQFLQRKVHFLGHVIEDGQLFPSPDKIAAVANYPELKSVKDVQRFLGLTGYFRKFMPNYSLVAKPLTDLLKKDSVFRFEGKERNAFSQLKILLMHDPVLRIYRPNLETQVHTDASKDGYGAVLMQRDPNDDCFHPVYYLSKKTSPAESRYSSYELEVLAVVLALRKFRVYLLGTDFTVVTDCEALKRIMDKRDVSGRIARWVLILNEFNFKVEHRAATRMRHVDAFSRSPVLFVEECGLNAKIKKEQQNDVELKTIIDLLNDRPHDDYLVRDGILYKFVDGLELLVVPKSMQVEIIKSVHEKGHYASKRTEEEIKQNYFFPKMKQRIERVVANCLKCLLANSKAGKKEGYLHPLFKESLPLHTLHIDHLGPLESTNKNYRHLLAVIDAFTKFTWLYPTKSTTSAEVVSKLELRKCVFGNPVQIISDAGTAFTSGEFKEYCKKENIRHHVITTGLPRANGQAERLNRVIISILTKLSSEDPSKWYKKVGDVQRVINSTYQRSIDTSPFELLVGVKMKSEADVHIQELLDKELIAAFEEERNELRENAKSQILKVQDENRRTYNLRRRPAPLYQIGDLVAIKRIHFQSQSKLRNKYVGPYRVMRSRGNDSYEVKREGVHEGPQRTSTTAEYMKLWSAACVSSSEGE